MKQDPRHISLQEISAPVSKADQKIRERLANPIAKSPVEITLAGFSGVDPIPAGSDLISIREKIERLFTGRRPFRASFSGIEAFPGGSVVYFALADRKPFDAIHQLLRNLEIGFSQNLFSYTPHCSIRIGASLEDEEMSWIFGTDFPTEAFQIRDVSFCSLDPDTLDCALVASGPTDGRTR